MPAAPLILTLQFDAETFDRLDALRREHFPAARNVVPAHVTLFHALPGDRLGEIAGGLAATCAATPPFDLRFPGVRFLGKGVALELASAELRSLRATLADRWADWLTPQDRQRYNPHVTVQNKVDPPVARALFQRMKDDRLPPDGVGDGLLLWRYLGGPWELIEAFPFAERLPAPSPHVVGGRGMG